jgi:hypothetical protein
MKDYSLETGEYIFRLTCEYCGNRKNRVRGCICKPDEVRLTDTIIFDEAARKSCAKLNLHDVLVEASVLC